MFDTNVLISAIFWNGNEAKLIERVEEGTVEGYTSPQILEELERVRLGPKFKLNEDVVSTIAGYFTAIMHVIMPKTTLNIIQEDPPDNRVIECALEARADLIVSGDRHLLLLRRFKGMRISRASEALKLIE